MPDTLLNHINIYIYTHTHIYLILKKKLYEVGPIIILMLQMKKLRYRQIKQIAHTHTTASGRARIQPQIVWLHSLCFKILQSIAKAFPKKNYRAHATNQICARLGNPYHFTIAKAPNL